MIYKCVVVEGEGCPVPFFSQGICILFAYVNMAPTPIPPVYLLPVYLFTFVFALAPSPSLHLLLSLSVCLCVWIFSSVWNVTEILMLKFLLTPLYLFLDCCLFHLHSMFSANRMGAAGGGRGRACVDLLCWFYSLSLLIIKKNIY